MLIHTNIFILRMTESYPRDIVAVRKIKSKQPIHASNQNAVFEINPGHVKRPFQEPRHGTYSSLALPDQYLPTFLPGMPSIMSA